MCDEKKRFPACDQPIRLATTDTPPSSSLYSLTHFLSFFALFAAAAGAANYRRWKSFSHRRWKHTAAIDLVTRFS